MTIYYTHQRSLPPSRPFYIQAICSKPHDQDYNAAWPLSTIRIESETLVRVERSMRQNCIKRSLDACPLSRPAKSKQEDLRWNSWSVSQGWTDHLIVLSVGYQDPRIIAFSTSRRVRTKLARKTTISIWTLSQLDCLHCRGDVSFGVISWGKYCTYPAALFRRTSKISARK